MTSPSHDSPPAFVVVGNVNQGKSSIVAALAEDTGVPIDAMPGTTVKAGQYAFRTAEGVAFTVVDTPGFQRARHALAWMQQRSRSVADRRDVVHEFVKAHEHDDRFVDEVRLLQPILAGGSHIYVVDASARFEPSSEAEMEILRWTGQSGMAVLNRTRERDFSDEWRPILAQFFHLVREFNAHRATFRDRLDLLRAFREVREQWRAPMDRAITAMEVEWRSRTQRASAVMAGLMVDALSHVERRELRDGDDKDALRREIEARFADHMRGLERTARAEIEQIFGHARVERSEDHLALLDADLLSEESFRAFGLTRAQLAKQGLLWGGALGLAIDLMVGGLSGFAGMALGAGIGAVTGFLGTTQLTKLWSESSQLSRLLFPGATGRFLAVGPVTNPRFAWVLLDRALLHCVHVRDRSHARQDGLDLRADKQGVVATLPGELRDAIDASLREVLKAAVRAAPLHDQRSSLAASLARVLERDDARAPLRTA